MQGIVELECSHGDRRYYKILEIGSWAGGSAITWADAIRKSNDGLGSVTCIDSWATYNIGGQGGIYETMGQALESGEIIHLFLHNIRSSGHEEIIRFFRARSEEILPLFKLSQFDLIFVDGGHTYQQVLIDLDNTAPLVRDGGILCGDDLELQTSEIDAENARENSQSDFIRDPKTNKWFHPGVTLAVADRFGEVSAWEGLWAMRRKTHGWEKVVADKLDRGEIRIPEHLK